MDDHAAPLLPHVSGGGLSHVENAGQVYRHHLVPFSRRDVEKVMADANACIVDQHIHCTHHADCLGKCRLDLLEVRHVGSDSC